MPALHLTVDMDNAAFEQYPEVELASVLHKAVKAIEEGNQFGALLDTNGNAVGSWRIRND